MATSTLPHFCCLLLLLLPLLPTVFSYTEEDCNIRLDKPLVAQQKSIPFTSSFGEFSFGFQFHPLESEKENQFLLAVWFYKTKDPSIAWSANGNKPATLNCGCLATMSLFSMTMKAKSYGSLQGRVPNPFVRLYGTMGIW